MKELEKMAITAKLTKGKHYQEAIEDDRTIARAWGEVTDIEELNITHLRYIVYINGTDFVFHVDNIEFGVNEVSLNEALKELTTAK